MATRKKTVGAAKTARKRAVAAAPRSAARAKAQAKPKTTAKPKAKPKPKAKRAAAPAKQPAAVTTPALLASKCTAVAFVEAIEPVLPFWAKVGFFPAVTVPHGDRAGFVILNNGRVELMYQTWGLLAQDMPALGKRSAQPDKVFLFVEVGDLDAVTAALAEYEVYLARRETFYGSTEIGYRDPQGHFVTFAQFK
jgi:hypothetical protein